MSTLTKIGLFVLIVAVGIFLIDNSLSAATDGCKCVGDSSEVENECVDICWNIYGIDCLYVYEYDSGCEFWDCVTAWKFKCENGAYGYIITSEFCWECMWM
jgi:hypothetical protein